MRYSNLAKRVNKKKKREDIAQHGYIMISYR